MAVELRKVKPDPLGAASVDLAKSLINAVSCTQAANTGNANAGKDLPKVMAALAESLLHYGEALREPAGKIIVGRMVQG